MDKNERSERNWVLIWAGVIVLLSSLPYILGILLTPKGFRFLGLTHNIDDGAVYLSWMRQAADGHFFIRNLFTNEPQTARAFNVFFLLMGNFGRITHLPLIWVFHLFRVGLGICLIWSIWRFAKLFLDDCSERKLLIPLVGLSAGIGWLIPNAQAPTGPVDIWQPEAITFLSIYLNPLFLVGLMLMLWSFYFLIRMQRAGRAGDAVIAGIILLVLGNVHTYDVITVAGVWAVYVVADCASKRRFDMRLILLSFLAAAIALPSMIYQYHLYQVDPVFQARANSPTPSPQIWSFFAGYGLILAGAIAGVGILVNNGRLRAQNSKSALFLYVWSVIGFVLPYIPVGQQRKLVMGLHIPLCILCAVALTAAAKRVPEHLRRSLLLAFILLAMISNLKFIARDMKLLTEGRTVTHYSPFIDTGSLESLGWLRRHAKREDTLLASPDIALFSPALIGQQVYYGHWSETPDYTTKIREWFAFTNSDTPVDIRKAVVRHSGAKYVITGEEVFEAYDLSLEQVGDGVMRVNQANSQP